MIAVIFQVKPNDGRAGDYFELAGALKPEVEAIDGFISVERFESVSEPGKFVSLSFWRDAAAVEAWRTHAGHELAQTRGKDEIFSDFRISVTEVMRDYTMADRVGGGGEG
jgi:heme-degrading monooxygenase HmoA